MRLIFVLAVTCTFCFPSIAQDFKIQKFNVRIVQHPQNLVELVRDTLSNDDVVAAAQIAAAFYGIDASSLGPAAAIAKNLNRRGERTIIDLESPEGYTPCRIKIEEKSLNGPGTVAIRVFPGKIQLDSNISINRFGDGRNWADIEITLVSMYWRKYRNPDWNQSMGTNHALFVGKETAYNKYICRFYHDWERPNDAIGAIPYERHF